MKVTIIQKIVVFGEESVMRKDSHLPCLPVPGASIFLKNRTTGQLREETLRDVWPISIVEGDDRAIIYLQDFVYSEQDGLHRTAAYWLKQWIDFGFAPVRDFTTAKQTPWAVHPQTGETPERPSPCCGAESGEVACVGTAFIYQCGLCGQRWHFHGGRQVLGTPIQEEPGVRLPPEFQPLDPTEGVKAGPYQGH